MSKKALWVILAVFTILLGLAIIFISKIVLVYEQNAAPNEPIAINTPPVFTAKPTVEFISTFSPFPTSEPTPELTPEPTPEPTLEPTPEPPSIRFIESKELHLPNMSETVWYGQRFNLRGTVLSEYPLKKVTVRITAVKDDDPICPYTVSVNFPNDKSVSKYALDDASNTSENKSINDLASLKFKELSPGKHIFEIIASSDNEELKIASTMFEVEQSKDGWMKLVSNNFRNNYYTALKFFGDEKKFMFKYKWENNDSGRNIITDPAWVKEYITAVKGINGKWWTVHKEAVPYYQNAINYLETTYLRVRSQNHDSGIIQLSALMKSFNGTYASRFVSDRSFISHHAFGTAIDINAGTKPFNNVKENWKIIKTEVKHLTYNGIFEENGRKYYDFTYNGDWEQYYNDVPESCLNFLLYELAFYRAGFAWGYYYPHTCDGMHFTLTDLDKSLHEAPKTGLRKVFEYYN